MVLKVLILAGAASIGALVFSRRKGGGKARGGWKRSDALNAFQQLLGLKGDVKGPLRGIKFAIQDVYDVKGRVTGLGSPAWAATHPPATRDAPAVASLRDAGADCVGVTRMDELGCSISGCDAVGDAPINTGARGRCPGGPASGAAAAVAAALKEVDMALAVDSSGGVRVPAAHCGLYAIRTTHGTVTLGGTVGTSGSSLASVGWMARDPDVIAATATALIPVPKGTPINISRVMVLEDALDLCDDIASCGVATACMLLKDAFKNGGITRLNLGKHLLMSCPSLRAMQDADCTTGLDVLRNCLRLIEGEELWSEIGGWYSAKKPETGANAKAYLLAASKVAPDSLRLIKEAREEVRAAVDTLLDGVTVFLMPTTPCAPPPLNASVEATATWERKTLQLTCLSSLTGCPQLTIPLTHEQGEGPYGLSVVAGRGQDYMCIEFSRMFGAQLREAFPDVVQAELTRPSEGENGAKDDADAVPSMCEELKAQGNAEFKAGNFNEAVVKYTEALSALGPAPNMRPDPHRAWRSVVLSNRAMTNLKLGVYNDAEDDCTAALKLNEKNVKAFLRRGAARSVMGNYLEALDDFERALQIEPKNGDAKSEIVRMKNIIGDADQTPDFDM
jgi:Asp-tRNA(Asn)/Glu-tRNA(Gln) amidotransferase A subunit family amidase